MEWDGIATDPGSWNVRNVIYMTAPKTFKPDQWVVYKDEENIPPIVSEELWEKANLI